jgi:hypothetical protein
VLGGGGTLPLGQWAVGSVLENGRSPVSVIRYLSSLTGLNVLTLQGVTPLPLPKPSHPFPTSFHVQIEVLRNPAALANRPVAIRQLTDIIAVNYAARGAGVTKHMAVDTVSGGGRGNQRGGGGVLHVPTGSGQEGEGVSNAVNHGARESGQ